MFNSILQKNKSHLIGMLALLLSGCASAPHYQPPQHDQSAASIHGYSVKTNKKFLDTLLSSSCSDWHNAQVTRIDGQEVDYKGSLFEGAPWYQQAIPITAGKHTLTVETDFDRPCDLPNDSIESFQAVTVMTINAKPGVHYRLNGDIENTYYATVWVETQNAKRVSNKISTVGMPVYKEPDNTNTSDNYTPEYHKHKKHHKHS